MATQSIQVLRPGDLGANLTNQNGQIVARTIVKQADINGAPFLIDSNNEVMPLEKWAGATYRARLKATLRTIQLADLTIEDTPGQAGWHRVTLKPNTVLATLDSVEGSTQYNFEGMTLWGQANLKLEMTHLDSAGGPYGVGFGKPLSDFPYITFFTYGAGNAPVLPNSGVVPGSASAYVGQVMPILDLDPGVIQIELSDEAFQIAVDLTGTPTLRGRGTKIWDVPPGDSSLFNFADWANPTQVELDAVQSTLNAGLLSGLYASANGNTAPPFQIASDLTVDLGVVVSGATPPNKPSV